MKVGDLVRNLYPGCSDEIGIVVNDASNPNTTGIVYTILWMTGQIEYMNYADLAVVNESR